MPSLSILLVAFGVGLVTGLRSMTGLAAVAWGARLGWIRLEGTGFSFMALPMAAPVATLAALGEFVVDKLPMTPSRKAWGPFAGRIVLGGFCGAALGTGAGAPDPVAPAISGVLGAVAGAVGGYEVRVRLPRRFGGKDWPFALAEDIVAVGLALFLVSRLAIR